MIMTNDVIRTVTTRVTFPLEACAFRIFFRARHRDISRAVKSRDEHSCAWRPSQGSPIKGTLHHLKEVRNTLSKTLDLQYFIFFYLLDRRSTIPDSTVRSGANGLLSVQA